MLDFTSLPFVLMKQDTTIDLILDLYLEFDSSNSLIMRNMFYWQKIFYVILKL